MCRVLETAFFIFLYASLVAAQEGPLVQTVQGLIRGVTAADGDYNQFLGIRYGTVDHTNRFKGASPPPTWEGILDADEDIQPCPQRTNAASEDCLLLNVFAPNDATANSSLPVMVYIHGGSFRHGDGSRSRNGPQFIVRHGVVLVVINYRLGPFGFLCLGTEEIPGNAGLKDQVYALRWVRDNIAAFGGDPDNVTIFGNSAGGASVEYLVVSPMASGLFQKAIAQSGSVISPWALQRQPVENAFALGSQLGITTTDAFQLQDSLLNLSTAAILAAEASQIDTLFSPCIENTIEGTESFITTSPYDIVTSGHLNHVPYMIGYTDKEGMLLLPEYITETAMQNLQNNFRFVLPFDLTFPSEDDRNEVVQRIYQFYFGQDNLSMDKAEDVVDYFSDAYFISSIERSVHLHLQHSNQPIYFYEFRYDGELNFLKYNEYSFLSDYVNITGACHSDEHGYQFVINVTIPNANAEDQLMVDRMTLLWTNFAKYGNPTPEINDLLPVVWSPVTSESLNYLILDQNLVLDQNALRERLALWEGIYEQFYVETWVTDNATILTPRIWTLLVVAVGSILIQISDIRQ